LAGSAIALCIIAALTFIAFCRKSNKQKIWDEFAPYSERALPTPSESGVSMFWPYADIQDTISEPNPSPRASPLPVQALMLPERRSRPTAPATSHRGRGGGRKGALAGKWNRRTSTEKDRAATSRESFGRIAWVGTRTRGDSDLDHSPLEQNSIRPLVFLHW